LFGTPEIQSLPKNVVLTDDPLRAKMLVAHHLEYSTPVYEQDEVLIYSGGYKGVPIAVVSAGFGHGAVLLCLDELIKPGVEKVIYISACASSIGHVGIGSVVLASGGSSGIFNKAITAAAKFGITASTQPVTSSCVTSPEDGCITEDTTHKLYEQASDACVEALSILTVSDNTLSGEKMEEHEIRSRFYAASRLAFETFALEIENSS